jgi:hypothetical protein
MPAMAKAAHQNHTMFFLLEVEVDQLQLFSISPRSALPS